MIKLDDASNHHFDPAAAQAILMSLRTPYLAALLRGSGREADRVVEQALQGGVRPHDVYLDLFQPAAYTIGDLWQRNECSIVQEHLATAIIEREIDDLHPLFKPQTPAIGRSLVIGCVYEELHRIGCRMVADFFEQAGWMVHYLGASVPTDTFLARAREHGADLIGLSAHLDLLPSISELVQQLGHYGLDGLPVMVGGLPFTANPLLYKSLGVHFSGVDAQDAVLQANALFQQ